MHKTKVMSAEQKMQIDKTVSCGRVFEKSVVDLISWAWLFNRYAKPFIAKWQEIIKPLVKSGAMQSRKTGNVF